MKRFLLAGLFALVGASTLLAQALIVNNIPASGGGGGGGGSIGGTISANQVAFGSAADTITGSTMFTFDPADQAAETPNLQLFSNSSGTQGYLMEVDSTSTAAGSTANYPRMFHSVFNMNGTGTVTGKRVMPASLEVFNSTTGTITWSSSVEAYAENLANGNWTTMLGVGSRLFNDGVGTVGRMVAFATSETDHFQNGNYGGGAVTYYAAFEGNGVNANGTYGDLYGLKLVDQSTATVTGNNHAINYNDTFIVDSTGAIYNGINSSKVDDIDSSLYTAPALAGAGAGNVSNGTHRYKFTLGNSAGTIHTAGGTATAAVTVADKTVNGQVTVTIPAQCYPAMTGVGTVRIYRDKNSDGVYLLVDTSPTCTRTFTDNVADGSLGAAIPTTNNTEAPLLKFTNGSVGNAADSFGNHDIKLLNPADAALTSEFNYYYIVPQDRLTATTPHMGIALFGNQNEATATAGMDSTEGGHLVLQGGAESTGGYAFIAGGAAFAGTGGSDALEGGSVTAYGSSATDAGRIEIVSGVAFAGGANNLNGGNVTIQSGAPANAGHYGDLLVSLFRNITMSASGPVSITGGTASVIETDTTTAHTFLFKAYDVDGTAYKTFATLTNGNTPNFDISAPSGGTLTSTNMNLTTPTVTTSLLFANGQGIYDEAADVLGIYRSTNPQTLRVYNTRTDASNYERLEIFWSSNVAILWAHNAGTGTARQLRFLFGDSSAAMTIPTSADQGITIATAGTWAAVGNRVRMGGNQTVNATSGNHNTLLVDETAHPTSTSTMVHRSLFLNPTINYSAGTPGAGSYEALKISAVETALPTGTNYLIRASAGSGGTTDEFLVTNGGDVTATGTIKGGGYKSSDGSTGATVTTCTSFKNGLCVAGT